MLIKFVEIQNFRRLKCDSHRIFRKRYAHLGEDQMREAMQISKQKDIRLLKHFTVVEEDRVRQRSL
jgi:hypothetical protein